MCNPSCPAEISEAWYQVVGTYQSSNPELAAFMLETLQRYVHWVDIGLVANGTFVPLLFSVLGSPDEQIRQGRGRGRFQRLLGVAFFLSCPELWPRPMRASGGELLIGSVLVGCWVCFFGCWVYICLVVGYFASLSLGSAIPWGHCGPAVRCS
jgi:hypothetical protein